MMTEHRMKLPPKRSFSWALGSFINNLYNFTKRSTRAEYWYMFLVSIAVNVVVGILCNMMPGIIKDVIMVVDLIGFEIPMLALKVRRLIDYGDSYGGIVVRFVLLIIPLVDIIVALNIIYDLAGTSTEVDFGPKFTTPSDKYMSNHNLK